VITLKRAALAICLLGAAGPAAAQQQPDTVATPAQRALERLRSMGAVSQPDTAVIAADTLDDARSRAAVDIRRAAAGQAAPGRIERDSVMTLLLGVPAYVATEYQGDVVRFDADSSRLELRGSPQVAREGSQLVADSLIVYDERIARACGYGDPVLHAVGMTHPLASDTVCFDVQRQVGYARGAQTSIAEGATWNLRGEVLVIHGDDFFSHRAIFTDCDLPWPHQHYHFGAREVKVVRDNVLVARDVTLNFGDVPVFWLPFMVQSLSQGRRSGLLMPRFGINDIARAGTRYSRRIEDVGAYWAINDQLGAELALDWFSDNWTGLRGSFDYNFARQFLRGGLTYRQFWKQEGGREFTLASQNSWKLNERTDVSLTGNYSTSTAFVRQRTFDPRELNRSIDSYGSLRRRFDWGSMSLGASRKQFLSDNTVNLQLPNLSLNFTPITLFGALPGEESWYSNSSWQGGFDVRMDRVSVGELNANRQAQSRQNVASSARSGFTVGRLSWGQSFSFDEVRRDERTFPGDTLPSLAAFMEQTARWTTSINFQQRLVGTSTLTPGLTLAGAMLRGDRTDNEMVSGPTRIDFNAALRTELFGFWPGVGPFERLRHRLSPNINYSYSPAVRADSIQRGLFGLSGSTEQNRVSIGVSQTFEGRRRAVVTEVDAAAADTAATDPTAPRRREQVAPITILSIATDAVVYDFVRARERGGRLEGVVTTEISNSIQSELLRGLQLTFAHDLWRSVAVTPPEIPGEGGEGTENGADGGGLPLPAPTPRREFAPHLSRVNLSFSLSSDSWLFRVLGLSGRGAEPDTAAARGFDDEDPMGAGSAVDRTQSEFGMVGTSRRMAPTFRRGQVGSWNANFNYTLVRPRESAFGENQMMTGNFAFQPTEHWSVRWSTGFSFTTSGFTDHILTLTRTMHDWDANFDFVKAQNGNFSFQFRVNLRANPDIKLDYTQTDAPGVRREQSRF
jgi:hypothetical protein